MYNKVILIGHLGQDADSRVLENGQTVTKLSLATSKKWKDKDDEWQENTSWHTIILWGYKGESSATLKKGARVQVDGRLSYRTHTTDDGIKRYYTEIVANSCLRMDRSEQQGTFPTEEDATMPAPVKDDDDLPY